MSFLQTRDIVRRVEGPVSACFISTGDRPAGEQAQVLCGIGSGSGGVDDQGLVWVRRQDESLKVELQVPDDRVVQGFPPHPVQPHIMVGPQLGEVLAAGGQFPDEIAEDRVVRVAPGRAAQAGGQVGRVVLPVGKKLAGHRIEESEAGDVYRLRLPARARGDGAVVQGCKQGSAQLVGGQHVRAVGQDERRRIGHRVEDPLDLWADLLLGAGSPAGVPAPQALGVGGLGQVEQVGAFRFVELEGARHRREYLLGDPGEVSPLQAGVIVHADTGQQGDFLTPQTGYATVPTVGREAGGLRGDAVPAGLEKLPGIAVQIHVSMLDQRPPGKEGLPVPVRSATPRSSKRKMPTTS